MRDLQRVLLVDDDPDIGRIGELALGRVGGLDVEVCKCGDEALARAPDYRPDLILLDVMMPGMDGPSVLQALRGIPQTRETPVVFMTAKVQTGEIAHYLEMGAIGVVKKPFEPFHLVDELRQMWNRHHEEHQDDDETQMPDDVLVDYRRKVDERIALIDTLLARMDEPALVEMRSLAHRLAGSGAIFGLPEVSEICAEFEEIVVGMLARKAPPRREDLRCLRELCARLRASLEPPRPSRQLWPGPG